jgi:uncharacterized membrane-anchored protein
MERRRQWPRMLCLQLMALFCLLVQPARAEVLPRMEGVDWTVGPAQVPLGAAATLELPAGYRFAGPEGAKEFNKIQQNLPDSSDVGVLIPPLEQYADPKTGWCIFFKYFDEGYVKDNEKDLLDADAVLKALQQVQMAGNAERRQRGWPTLQITGWQQPPAYDAATHHLTWAIQAISDKGKPVANYDSRILGRSGVIQVRMVLAPGQLTSTIPTCRMIESQIHFIPGKTYQEFRAGDRVAQYGLTALITGGVTVAVFKAWKPLLAVGAAVVAFLAAIGRKILALITRKSPAVAIATANNLTPRIVVCPRCQQKNRIVPGSQGAVCGQCKMPLS